jgi:GT2 family glycosyltransferase
MKLAVIIPTIKADYALDDCLRSLAAQSFTDFETVVVVNAPVSPSLAPNIRIVQNEQNTGYGKAVNQGIAASSSDYILALNDDTVLRPNCLEQLVAAMDARYEIGMCAPQIRLADSATLDSTGLLIAGDGSSKQRMHGHPAPDGGRPTHALLPSGCAALYRRAMLDEIGLFEEDFFLYCEDTDLGLRARWKAWECVYVPSAVVEHKYSHSSSKASALKAYYVERNRILVVIRNFPMGSVMAAPFHTIARFYWHWRFMRRGQGAAAAYDGSELLVSVVFRAWRDALLRLPAAWRKRRHIQSTGRVNPKQFKKLLKSYRISGREVASQ